MLVMLAFLRRPTIYQYLLERRTKHLMPPRSTGVDALLHSIDLLHHELPDEGSYKNQPI